MTTKLIFKFPVIETEQRELPKGKLNVRFRQERCVYQCFAGRTYLPLASGDEADEAISELKKHYKVPQNAEIAIH